MDRSINQVHTNNIGELLLDALASLNQIGTTINRFGSGAQVTLEEILSLVVESATKVIPGAAAVIYAYLEEKHGFDINSRVSAGDWMPIAIRDQPRPNGLGMRAIAQLRRVLSYEETDIDIHPLKAQAGARQVACCPMIVADSPVGILYVYLNQDRPFSQLELLMLDIFVNQAGMAVARTRQISRAQRDLARKDDELSRLRRASLLLSSRLKLDETLETILQMGLEVTGAQYGILRLLDKEGKNLITKAVAGEQLKRPLTEALSMDDSSITSWVARNRQPICIQDLHTPPWVDMYYPLDEALKMRSELAVPLIGAGKRLEGVLNLESPQAGAFSEQDSHLLQSLATQAVIAIQEARLLDALQEVAELLLVQPVSFVLNHLVHQACDLLNVQDSVIWILDDRYLVVEAASSPHRFLNKIPLENNLPGQVILRAEPVYCDDLMKSLDKSGTTIGELPVWKQALIVPILSSENPQPVGAFCVCSTENDHNRLSESDWDKKVLTCLAHYAALALRNASHLSALREAEEQRAIAETFAAVGDIAANLLHHLNNKVGTIPVRVQGIQAKCESALASDAYLSDNLDEIQRSAREAMAAVRENLIHLNPIHLVSVDLAASIRGAINEANLPPHIRINMEGIETLPSITAGERSLRLVFVNLLQNAAEAMSGKGEITIMGISKEDGVEIVIKDNGPGIPPDIQEHIFELNFSGKVSRPGKLGFGLWWVKTLMTRLNGTVSVESDGMHGTAFRLVLPVSMDKK
jgi:GAF domain-containing protein